CDANAEITILEKGPAVSFANCGLPYHLGGEIEEREKLLVATPELFWARFRIRVRTGHEVTSIAPQAKTVTGRTADGEEFKLPYDKLMLSLGSEPLMPDFAKVDAENVHQLWTLDDMDSILSYLKKRPCKKATVIGGGFVGLEVVEQLHRLGINVTLLERNPQVLKPVDRELARMIENAMLAEGVKLHLGVSAESLLINNSRATAIKLASGESLATDLVIVGIGVRARTQIAEAAGFEVGPTGGLVVNEHFQTSDPNIYAVGDMVEYHRGVLDKKQRIPLAGPANRAGRIAGQHAATGAAPPAAKVQGTSIVRVFDLGAGVTGLNEQTLKQNEIPFRSATVQAAHHASYFPGAKPLTVKIHYCPNTRKLLGGQAVGKAGVDKRVDVLATLLHFGGTIDDLAGIDLAYAPPFGSAKDILHMAAFVAQNDLANAPKLTPPDAELADLQVVDVRTAAELEKLPLPGAIHIPIDELSERFDQLDASLPTVTVCHSGKRAHVAACWLSGKGFENIVNLNGGMSIRSLTGEP
ncbi:MAG TPA: NADH oxidase, partial [Planctomycetaceae bacterium]|nr:NADH oxidase [Planctomycetaceae bacterium]